MKFKYQKLPYGGSSNRTLIARPYIPVHLHSGSQRTPSPYYALLDSGADSVLMPAELGEVIGITDFKSGNREDSIGVAGQRAEIYYHEIELQIVGSNRKLKIKVGFGEHIFIPLLGRTLFRHFKAVIFEETKEQLELKD